MPISTDSSSKSAANVSWTDLPSDVVDSIVHRFEDILDFIYFGATCRAWRSVTLAHLSLRCCRRKKHSQIPWILLVRPKIEQPASPTKESGRTKPRLSSIVPPLCFYNFSSKKCYFFSHPPHLMPDINKGNVILIGADNGYLIYISNSIGIVHETVEEFSYFVKYHSLFNSSPNSILHLYDPVNGSHFSLPPAPVFDINKIVVNKNPHTDNVTVAVACYDDGIHEVHDPDGSKTCIALVRTGDSEWTRLHLSKVITADFIKDVVFHQERLYVLTNDLKLIVFEGINDPSSLSKEAICMECPKHVLYEVEENEPRDETKANFHGKPIYYEMIYNGKLAQSPDKNVLILCATCMVHLATDSILMEKKVFEHDWSRGQWDLVKYSSDFDLSFLESLDMLFVIRKSQSHLIADCSTKTDIFSVYDVGCQRRTRLNVPRAFKEALYLWFVPNLC